MSCANQNPAGALSCCQSETDAACCNNNKNQPCADSSQEQQEQNQQAQQDAQPVRRFVGKKKINGEASAASSSAASSAPKKTFGVTNQIPTEILDDPDLNNDIAGLPANYNFEIHKSVWRIRQTKAKCVALQMPEGFTLYACTIADIIQKHTGADTVIMGDVTYGACCVDDYTAKALGADFLIHYAHSCLVPIDTTTGITVLYVFVDIKFDLDHFVETVKYNFEKGSKLAMVATIQFVASLHAAKTALLPIFPDIFVPQARPLSPGEILGCTSPILANQFDALVYLGDGRFHLESIMISNPALKAYRYDPYSKVFSIEGYDHDKMHEIRQSYIQEASKAKRWGIILGTLGRQGSPNILARLQDTMREKGKDFITILLSEIFPHKLDQFPNIDAWVQIACPRLSIDWGRSFTKPVLTPYEANVALQATQWREIYPMDYYSKDGGQWTNYYGQGPANQRAKKPAASSASVLPPSSSASSQT